ncbi:M16 family metallopeptidase [Pseudomonas oryzihabitans]|uniref:M16 family metallopeptidase n=1 Tax=Pseudomonas oryzihabitans TaxID=47885 RepID=UPI00214E287D|nr:pitrilysin family protein [Pseudomonas psychrotolerans]UUW70227.1 insulinase family protein [Pseudomonas psychrotolerans]
MPASRFRRTALVVLLSLLPTLALATASRQNTEEFTLDNGLKLVVREDHRAPVAVVQLWYRVGSSLEAPSATGLSHALEHLMFKGSRKLGAGEASHLLRDLGAEENAFTTDDYTVYYQLLARDRLPVALELEADRMQHLRLAPDEVSRELEVIKEERRLRTDDRPEALSFERFKAAAYPASGYRNPTIGWPQDLQRLGVDDLRRWYQTWYAPNNATLVVVGDVEPQAIRAEVQRWFGSIPRSDLAAPRRPLELPAPGERRLALQARELPSLLMSFNVPSLATAAQPRDAYALQLLAALLSGGSGARLPSRLERGAEVASSVRAAYGAYTRGDSLFLLSGTPNTQRGKTLDQLEAAFWAQLDLLKREPPSAEELARVRALLVAGLVYGRDSITAQASSIGQLESVGLGWRQGDRLLDELGQVTPDDLRRVARTYFTRERLTLGQLRPEPTAEARR